MHARRGNRQRSFLARNIDDKAPTLQMVAMRLRAVLVTTAAAFTKAARSYAAKMNIRLVDGANLAAWASQTGPAPWQ